MNTRTAPIRNGRYRSLTVTNAARGNGAQKYLRTWVSRACRELGLVDPSVTVVVVGDETMSDLHRRFRGVAGTTDVLTFDLSDGTNRPARIGRLEGEIYVCLDEARRRAPELGHDVGRELLLYAVHGLLHLMGYDDHAPADYRKMHAMEDEVLRAIGVGAVFAPGRGAGGRA